MIMRVKFVFIVILSIGMFGCEVEKFASDEWAVNTYECRDSEAKTLFQCQLIDSENNLTRWERVSDWARKQICADEDCTTCRNKLNANEQMCEVGKYQCNNGRLQECQLFDFEKNLAIWVPSDVCTGDCDKCLEQIDKNCRVGDFRCGNNGELQECQRISDSKELTKWENSDICTMNCNACLNALHEGCSNGEIQCDANQTFICEESGLIGSVDVWKTTEECQNVCSSCADESCQSCIDKHNAALKKCEKNDEYFDYKTQKCVPVDANYNHMHDQYENAKNAGDDCSVHSECDSEPDSADGFCDSYIGYKC